MSVKVEESVQVRVAEQSDALCLSALAMQVFLDTYATDGINPPIAREVFSTLSQSAFDEAIVSNQQVVLVAERASHLVGFAKLELNVTHDLAPAGAASELVHLYIQEGFAGAGLGSRLLAQAERAALKSGVSVMWLNVWAENARALAFYKQRAYIDCGQTSFELEDESYENRFFAKILGGSNAF